MSSTKTRESCGQDPLTDEWTDDTVPAADTTPDEDWQCTVTSWDDEEMESAVAEVTLAAPPPGCGDGILQAGEEYDPAPGPFMNVSVDSETCRWDFSEVEQLYCYGLCSWAGPPGCDASDADVLCKLITDNPDSEAISYTVTAPARPLDSLGSTAASVTSSTPIAACPMSAGWMNPWRLTTAAAVKSWPSRTAQTPDLRLPLAVRLWSPLSLSLLMACAGGQGTECATDAATASDCATEDLVRIDKREHRSRAGACTGHAAGHGTAIRRARGAGPEL